MPRDTGGATRETWPALSPLARTDHLSSICLSNPRARTSRAAPESDPLLLKMAMKLRSFFCLSKRRHHALNLQEHAGARVWRPTFEGVEPVSMTRARLEPIISCGSTLMGGSVSVIEANNDPATRAIRASRSTSNSWCSVAGVLVIERRSPYRSPSRPESIAQQLHAPGKIP